MIRIIDLETTGFGGDATPVGIVQIGMIELNSDFGEQRRFETLVNPDISLEHWQRGAVETHGITPEMVKDAPFFHQIFNEFADKMVGGTWWIGYNSGFDYRILISQLTRYNLMHRFPWPPRELDMMPECTRHLGAKPGGRAGNWKLADAYTTIVSKPFEGTHNALSDCRAVAEIMRHIVDRSRFDSTATRLISDKPWMVPYKRIDFLHDTVELVWSKAKPAIPWPKPQIKD